ncbi:16S rRNA (guanine(966)-N(2))-methyltransferase RsmD [Geminicoccaceae bacterium 1502E]|nr:16S rRNA (guanine(966)-N(2))-methyltransferase RsmD [Geminicoccaceae bacterium 1502E]
MRIVAGRHRGCVLRAPPGRDTRPTSDRAREALFSILESRRPAVRGARFLDLFAGTGAVGLEAVSRGAAEAVLVDQGRPALEALRANVARLGEEQRVRVLAADATRLGRAPHPFDLVFLDPPYRSGLAPPALAAALAGGWIAPEARVIVEVATGEPFAPPEGLQVESERRYGAARLVFLGRGDAQG